MPRQIPALARAAEIVYAHQKFDGTGYPRGLKGDTIPLGARIVAVADSFDMLIGERPHCWQRALRYAGEQISRWSGTCFDPEVVDVFLRMRVDN